MAASGYSPRIRLSAEYSPRRAIEKPPAGVRDGHAQCYKGDEIGSSTRRQFNARM